MVRRLEFVEGGQLTLAAMLVVACLPPALNESGRHCDRLNRPCGGGYVCFDGTCALPTEVDAGPDNWLGNGGFEEVNDAGDPLLWHALAGELTTDTRYVHEGMRSVRLFSRNGGDQLQVTLTGPGEVKGTVFGQVWCARAWARSNRPDGGLTVQLVIRERANDGGTTAAESASKQVRVLDQWTQLEEVYEAEGADRLDVGVTHLARAEKTDLLWVDDVRLKRSATGECIW